MIDSVSAAINTFAQSLVLQPADNIVFCDIEFPANAYPWMSLERDGVVTRPIPPVKGGLTLEALQAAVDDRTRVVAASAIQFFTGHRTDLTAIGQFCRERGIIFVVDAIQAVGHMPIDVQKAGIDVLVAAGHKSLLAGTGVGFMYVRDAICETVQPRLISSTSTGSWPRYLNYDLTPAKGAQRFWMGTPNVAGMFGLLESLALIKELTREAIERHTTRLAAYVIERAQSLGYELVTQPGEHGPIVTFKSGLDDAHTEALSQALEEQGITVGSPSDRNGVPHWRVSVHCYNTHDDIDRLFAALAQGR